MLTRDDVDNGEESVLVWRCWLLFPRPEAFVRDHETLLTSPPLRGASGGWLCRRSSHGEKSTWRRKRPGPVETPSAP